MCSGHWEGDSVSSWVYSCQRIRVLGGQATGENSRAMDFADFADGNSRRMNLEIRKSGTSVTKAMEVKKGERGAEVGGRKSEVRKNRDSRTAVFDRIYRIFRMEKKGGGRQCSIFNIEHSTFKCRQETGGESEVGYPGSMEFGGWSVCATINHEPLPPAAGAGRRVNRFALGGNGHFAAGGGLDNGSVIGETAADLARLGRVASI